MTYKAFQDFYHEANIRHLLLTEYNGRLVSPPFATEKCKEYSKVMLWNGNSIEYIELDLPPVTSKTNATAVIGDSLWLIPYGIWDEFNTVVQIKDTTPIYHKINQPGKGQFYSVAAGPNSAFSFPLGYEDTSFGLYIYNDSVSSINFDKQSHIKLHMGCVYANQKFWSMPRSDSQGYIDLVSFDGLNLEKFPIPDINQSVTRKYTDLIAVNDTLYSLPFGETEGLNEVVEFDTINKTFKLYPIPGLDFAKKYNASVLLNNKIIGVPYGDEYCFNSNLGIVFDTSTKEISQFDIGLNFGGKYRYRCGINYKNNAFFFPSGTPTCPILKIDDCGNIHQKKYLENTMLGRPIIYKDKMHVMACNLKTHEQQILSFNENLDYKVEVSL